MCARQTADPPGGTQEPGTYKVTNHRNYGKLEHVTVMGKVELFTTMEIVEYFVTSSQASDSFSKPIHKRSPNDKKSPKGGVNMVIKIIKTHSTRGNVAKNAEKSIYKKFPNVGGKRVKERELYQRRK